MLIQCTKKLLDELNVRPVSAGVDEIPLFSWHANLIVVNRRKTVVLVNDSSRYVIVLHGLKSRDFAKLERFIIDAIRGTLLAEYIKPEIVEQFIQCSPVISYGKTKDRAMVARLNGACETVSIYAEALRDDVICQSRAGIMASSRFIHDRNSGCIYHNESMYQELEALANGPVISCRAVELKITLELTNHSVWRRVIVPGHITFDQLHAVLQVLFDWKDCHLHDFTIFDSDKPVVNLVCDEEAFDYPTSVSMVMETESRISDYVPQYSRIIYRYDFGDDWRHTIEVQNTIENYPQNYPVCVEGEGNTPPEDVGGESGYDTFSRIIQDPRHSEHKQMLGWASTQWYRDFDIHLVNRRLKRSLNSW